MTDEKRTKRTWKEAVWINRRYYTRVFLEELREVTTKTVRIACLGSLLL